jgi:hypothetical protein
MPFVMPLRNAITGEIVRASGNLKIGALLAGLPVGLFVPA